MSFLPDLDASGYLLKDTREDEILMDILNGLRSKQPLKYNVAIRRVRNDGWSVRKALGEVGILVGLKN